MKSAIVAKRYKILTLLGRGKEGEVYLVFDQVERKKCALKMVLTEKNEDKNFLKSEFKILSTLTHPNLVAVYDFGFTKNNSPYFTMEYFPGVNIIDATRGLSLKDILPLLIQLLEAVEYIHSKGVIHYDLKPSNLLVHNNIVKVTDFGLSLPKNYPLFGKIRGTVEYVAPEIILQHNIDERVDLYSLGVLFYQIFTGDLPFTGDRPVEILKMHIEKLPTPPSKLNKQIPENIEKIILKLLEKDPDKRFFSCKEVKEKLVGMSSVAEKKVRYFYIDRYPFVGREQEIKKVLSGVKKGKNIIIFGPENAGKTELLRKVKVQLQLDGFHCFFTESDRGISSIVSSLLLYADDELIENYGDSLLKIFPELIENDRLKKFKKYLPLPITEIKARLLSHLTRFFSEMVESLGKVIFLIDDIDKIGYADIVKHLIRQRIGIWVCSSTIDIPDKNIYFDEAIYLKPFTNAELENILYSAIKNIQRDTARFIANYSGGNPLFARELLKYLYENGKLELVEGKWTLKDFNITLPDTLKTFIENRLSVLPEKGKLLLKYIASFEKPITKRMLCDITKLNYLEVAETVRELKSKGFLRETPRGIKLPSWIYKSLILSLRTDRTNEQIHKDIAEFMVTLESVDPGDVAMHFYNAGDFKNARNYALKAISIRKNSFDHSGYLKFLDIAIECSTDNERLPLLIEKGEVLVTLRKFKEAEVLFQKILKCQTIDKEKYLRVLADLGEIYLVTNQQEKAFKLLKEGYEMCDGGLENIKARFAISFGQYFLSLGKHDITEKYFIEALNISNDREIIGLAYNSLMTIYYIKCDYEKAETCLHEGIKKIGEEPNHVLALLLGNFGALNHAKGDFGKAIEFYRKSLHIHEKMENRRGVAICHANLGLLYRDSGEYEKSLSHYWEGRNIALEIGAYELSGWCLHGIGLIYASRGFYLKAKNYLKQAEKELKNISNKIYLINLLIDMGNLFSSFSESSALKYFEKGIKLAEKFKADELKGLGFLGSGEYYLRKGEFEKSEEYLKKALKISRDIKRDLLEAHVLLLMAELKKETNKLDESVRIINELEDFASSTKRKQFLVDFLILKGELTNNVKYFKSAMNLEKKLKNPARLFKIYCHLGLFYEAKGKFYEAFDYYNKALKCLDFLVKNLPSQKVKKIFMSNYKGLLEKIGGQKLSEWNISVVKELVKERIGKRNIQLVDFGAVSGFAETIKEYRNASDLIEYSLEWLMKFLGARKGFVFIIHELDGREFKKFKGIKPSYINKVKETLMYVLKKKEMHIKETQESSSVEGIFQKKLIYLPFLSQKFKGIFYVEIEQLEGGLWEEKFGMLKTILAIISFAYDNLLLYEEAVVDKLTLLYTRKYLDNRLKEELARSDRYYSPISLMMIDIDNFKDFNDNYGHQAGDRALKAIGETIRKSIRKSDIPARYGGEEFIVILPETDLESAKVLAERLIKDIRNIKLKGIKQRITVSIGIASHPVHQIVSAEDFIEKADKAMYLAKSRGKNQIAIYNLKEGISYEDVGSTQFLKRRIRYVDKEKLINLLELIDGAIEIENVDPLLEKLLDFILELIDAKRGFIMIKDYNGNIETKTARFLDKEEADSMISFSRSVVKEVLTNGKPLLIEDALMDSRFKLAESVSSLELRSIICVPVKKDNEIIGVVYLDNRKIPRRFSYIDLQLLESFTPFISRLISSIMKFEKIFEEKERLLSELRKKYSFESIIGKSEAIYSILKSITRVANSSVPVLIEGESGTGKDLIARAIHYNSNRASRPFIPINCAAIPENLLESELFGYAPGAFTGATKRKKGIFEAANGGTVFLDEIGEMPVSLQAKLLRFIETGEFIRLGEEEIRKVDVRILAATNKDIEKLVSTGRFREDLYYRLNVFSIKIPPLRERREDIPLLVNYLIEEFTSKEGLPPLKISPEALEILLNYDYPGNVRELRNIIQRAVILSVDKGVIGSEVLPDDLRRPEEKIGTSLKDLRRKRMLTLIKQKEEVEKRLILEMLEANNYNITKTAEALEIHRTTLYRLLKKYNIKLHKRQ